jgi:hypothetical protein
MQPLIYPELTTRSGLRDRAQHVDLLPTGSWEVRWRSGQTTAYDRDPRPHLELGYEPRPSSPHPSPRALSATAQRTVPASPSSSGGALIGRLPWPRWARPATGAERPEPLAST